MKKAKLIMILAVVSAIAMACGCKGCRHHGLFGGRTPGLCGGQYR